MGMMIGCWAGVVVLLPTAASYYACYGFMNIERSRPIKLASCTWMDVLATSTMLCLLSLLDDLLALLGSPLRLM